MCSGHNLVGKSQICSEVFNSRICQVAVVVLPAESDTDVLSGFQGLHQHEDFQVGRSLDLRMSGSLGVLLDNANSLLEEVAEDSNAVFLGDEHLSC